MSKLWEKGYELDALVELFTVGEDYILDERLVAADCVASMAHARTLTSAGILTEQEYNTLHSGLTDIISKQAEGNFPISRKDEDCHTAIENRLVEKCGDIGKKIHTGRSRNDQVLGALRLFTKFYLFNIMDAVLTLSEHFFNFADKHKDVPMPGRTHLQAGMPSSVGLWAAAFGEELLDSYMVLETAYKLNDQCPLGSAAGYGVPLPLDRQLTAALLGFSRVQNNVLYVQNSRGKIEGAVLNALEAVLSGICKAAWDIILFALPEFGYFSIPEELCSGSSIMPQKKNPDVLELIRSKAAIVGGYAEQIRNIVRPLYSGYNRDFQDTKGPFLKGIELGLMTVSAMDLTIRKLQVNPANLQKGFSPDIFATDYVLELVRKGSSFRDAYRTVAESIEKLGKKEPADIIQSRTSIGTTGNLQIDQMKERVGNIRESLAILRRKSEDALNNLAGFEVSVYQPPFLY